MSATAVQPLIQTEAMIRLCSTLDRMQGTTSLITSTVPQSAFRAVWPPFAVWMLGGSGRTHEGAFIEYTRGAPAVNELLRGLLMAFRGYGIADPTSAGDWRRLRGSIEYQAHEFAGELRFSEDGDSNSANAIAERTPELRCVTHSAEAASNAAWAMYADERFLCEAVALSVRYAGEAYGWHKAVSAWHRNMPLQANSYWRPELERGRGYWATRAAEELTRITGAS